MSSTAFLILLIKHTSSKPDFQAVADIEGMNKHAIEMRYYRLQKAKETKAAFKSTETGIKFLIQLIKHTPGKPDFQAVADALGIKKHAAEMRYYRLSKANPTETEGDGEGASKKTQKTKKRARSNGPGEKHEMTTEGTVGEDEIVSKKIKLECTEA